MDVTDIYNKIIERLNKSGHENVSADLERLLNAASTGGEGLESTGGYLLDLKKNIPTAFEIVKDLICDYIEYSRKFGIIFEA